MQAAFAMLVAIFFPAQNLTAEDIVRRATSNFEYRDFEKVIELLAPFVTTKPLPSEHPLMITAYELLGVSRHVTGDVAGARREFSELLRADPEHRLDPFKIPPHVIETFEALRREMKDQLDAILAERGKRPKVVEPPKGELIPVEVPTRLDMLLPGGAPQFILDQDGLGALFLTTQIVAVIANIVGFLVAEGAEFECDAVMDFPSCTMPQPAPDALQRRSLGRILWGVGLGTFAASYGVSIFLGFNDLPDYRESRLKPAPRQPVVPKDAGITFQLRF